MFVLLVDVGELDVFDVVVLADFCHGRVVVAFEVGVADVDDAHLGVGDAEIVEHVGEGGTELVEVALGPVGVLELAEW